MQPPQTQPGKSQPAKRKILLIDDEESILDIMLMVLQREGYSAVGVNSGAAALEKAREFSPDIVVCDLNLPDMPGTEILEGIRRLLPECRIILTSGQVAGTIDTKFDFIGKPFSPRELISKLRE